MFGYHDVPDCSFDLWAPNPTAWGDNAIENRAFSAYCFHTQELEDAIAKIAAGDDSVDCTDDMNDEDIAYIENELYKRYGIEVSISAY